ncbi:MAG: S-layer homology domain-containing protein, partial [Clostridia bacterium]|nr:S-layer homology domain-containing protein [Clostridia bacterium]
IQHLSNVGKLTGQGGAFNPEGTISRAEFIDLIQRVQGYGKLSYSGKLKDVAQDAWYLGCIEGALDAGIIPEQMIVDGNFSPDKPITCEEMLAIAARACNYDKGDEPFYASLDSFANRDGISDWYVKEVQNAVSLRLPGGSLAENGGMIPTANATRAQAAVIAKRVYIKTY